MKRSLIFICFIFASVICHAQVLSNANEAFTLAAKTNKPVLLVFSGSDWCQQCIRFDKTVLSDSIFQQEKFIVLKADFPQRKKSDPELLKQNELLAEAYNPKGLFPHIVLLRSDKAVISVLNYYQQSASQFIKELKAYLP